MTSTTRSSRWMLLLLLPLLLLASDPTRGQESTSRPQPPAPGKPTTKPAKPDTPKPATTDKRQAKIPHRRKMSRWTPVTLNFKYLPPKEHREFFRGPRGMRDRFPYLVLANADERAAGIGYELRADNAYQLLDLRSDLSALQLVRVLTGGIVVKTPEIFGEIIAQVQDAADQLQHWSVKASEGKPDFFRATAVKNGKGTGYVAKQLLLTMSGSCALGLEQQVWVIPKNGPAKITKRKQWMEGPPQSWQTAGEVDEQQQREMRGEVDLVREAMMSVFVRARRLQLFREIAYLESFAWVRDAVGEPDRVVHHEGQTLNLYRLPGKAGRVVVFFVKDVDGPMKSVLLVNGVTKPGYADGFKLGKTLEKIR
ncbi:MAG: hypothetical protein AAF581_00155 [Planctomycetota bacterium]